MSKITANSSSRTGKDHAHQSAAAAAASSDNDLKKGPWTAEEDHKLVDYIKKHGHGRWRTLPKHAGTYISCVLQNIITHIELWPVL